MAVEGERSPSIEKHADGIVSALRSALVDAQGEVRSGARAGFWAAHCHFAPRCAKLLSSLEPHTQRLVMEEEPRGGAVNTAEPLPAAPPRADPARVVGWVVGGDARRRVAFARPSRDGRARAPAPPGVDSGGDRRAVASVGAARGDAGAVGGARARRAAVAGPFRWRLLHRREATRGASRRPTAAAAPAEPLPRAPLRRAASSARGGPSSRADADDDDDGRARRGGGGGGGAVGGWTGEAEAEALRRLRTSAPHCSK